MSRRGYSDGTITCLAVLVICAVIGAAIAIVIALFKASNIRLIARGDVAEVQAAEHATRLGWQVKGISCAARDTDGDGYVSCTVNITDGKERAIECGGGAWNLFEEVAGCKTTAVPMAPQAGN